MVSIRSYTELLKSYLHLIMQPGVALILSETWLRLQTFQQLRRSSATSQSVSVTWRGSRRATIWRAPVIEIRGHEHNQAKPCKAGHTVLIGICLCCSWLSVFIWDIQRNNRSNFLRYYVFIIVILWQITFSEFSESQSAQPCGSIQVLLQLIIGVRVFQIAPF